MTQGRLLVVLAAISFVRPVSAQSPASDASRHPDFAGIWNSSTATPIERPARFKDKEFFTPQEAADFERQARGQGEEPPPRAASARGFGASYNAAFYESAVHVLKTLRTSIITDPPDGRIPALTPKAAAVKSRRQELLQHPSGAKDLGLQDQCLIFPTAVPPMLPYRYNSNYQFVQTGNELMLNAEMNHDTRIIHLDGRPHAPSKIRLWVGDSVGQWEGSTLVVDTANFNDSGGFFGDAGGMYGWDRNLHVVERFSLLDANTILYRFEVEDPTAFTRPWKGELTMARSPGPIYEYACHEGNYALPNLLSGFRATESDGAPPSRPKNKH
jgi:hypothetical protein